MGATPFSVPGATESSFKYCAIGDCHGNFNILRSMLEFAHEQGVSDAVLIGDQVDELKSSKYVNWGGQHDHYVKALRGIDNDHENEGLLNLEEAINLHITRGNHESGLDTAEYQRIADGYDDGNGFNKEKVIALTQNYDATSSVGKYRAKKHLWHATMGCINDKYEPLLPDYTEELSGELLDCGGMHATLSEKGEGSVLFVALDYWFTQDYRKAWLEANKPAEHADVAAWEAAIKANDANAELPDEVLTTLKSGQKITANEYLVLGCEFIETAVEHFKGQFKDLVVYAHYPLAGRNHSGMMKEDNSFPKLEQAGHDKLQANLIKTISDNNGIYLCGHDHFFYKGNVYATELDKSVTDHARYVDKFDFTPFCDSTKNTVGADSNAIVYNKENTHIKQFLVDSSSHKHYTSKRPYERNIEVPFNIHNTDATDRVVNAFLIVEIKGDMKIYHEYGYEHDFHDDMYSTRHDNGKDLAKTEENHLDGSDGNRWKLMSSTVVFANQDHTLVVPANYSYKTEIPASKTAGLKGTTAAILDGNNITFNAMNSDAASDNGAGIGGNKVAAYAEEINFQWLKAESGNVLSDVLFIDGMSEQTGLVLDASGNVVTGSTNGIDSATDDFFIEGDIQADPYTLALDIPAGADEKAVALARYNEETNDWITLDGSVKGGRIQATTRANGFFAVIAK